MSFVYTKYILSCDDVINNSDNTLTYVRVFDRKYIEKIPDEMNFYLVMEIEYSLSRRKDRTIKLRMLDPDKEKVVEDDLELLLRETKKNEIIKTLNKIKLSGLPITKEGTYSILVYHQDEIIDVHEIIFLRGERDGKLLESSS